MLRSCLLVTLLLACSGATAFAHYNILLPTSASAQKGEAVTFTYQWGHPFEHEFFDAPKPEAVHVLFPDGMTHKDLLPTLQAHKEPGAKDKQITAWRFKFTPPTRGDYVFFLQTPAIWLDDAKEFVQDIVRVTLHVQTQNGWDNDTGEGFRMVPMTRPYGILPGMLFQGRLLPARKNGDEEVAPHIEIERYNAAKPKEVPSDELVTFTTRYDPNGIFTFSFPEYGWWCFTGARDGGMKERGGREYPLRQRLTMWVHVDDRK